MWINFLIYECHLSYQARFLMLGYLSRYEVDLSVQITVAQLVKELRIDQVTVRKNLAELCENGLMKETTIGSGKKGRPVKTYALSGKFISLLGQPNQIPLQHIPYLESLALHNHYERKGRFRNGMNLNKGESLLLAVLIRFSDTSDIVEGLSQTLLSKFTGEKITTLKANLRKLEDKKYISKVSTRNVDDILIGSQKVRYFINLKMFGPQRLLELKLDALQPIPTLMLSDEKAKGIFDKSLFDSSTQELYEANKLTYLNYLKCFKRDFPNYEGKLRSFLNVNAAYLVSVFFRENWDDLDAENRISINTVESLFRTHLQCVTSLFKGAIALKFEPDSEEESHRSVESQISNVLNDYPKLQAACCFFFFFDVLSLAMKIKKELSDKNAPNLDHKNIFLSRKIFADKYRMYIYYLETDSSEK